MTIDNVKEEDSLIVDITITEDGAVKDVTGGTVTVAIRDPNGNIITTGVTGSIQDGPNGIARVTVSKDVFNKIGSWLGQARLEIGVESKTVWHEDVNIGASLIKDA